MGSVKASLVIISAPSGAGKTTIVKHILQTFPQLTFSISATTRKKRDGEIDGVDYYFLSQEQFQHHINNNDFIEWEMVYEGKYYGTLKTEINRIWNENKTPLLEVDVKGAIRLMTEYKDSEAQSLFIQIPSIAVLKERLEKRASEDAVTIAARIEKAAYELQFVSHFNHVVVNDKLDNCLHEVEQILTKHFL